MEKLPISLVIITLNESDNIRRCIESVPFASEVVVLDSGSSDDTRELAASLGAKVYNEKWRGFGKQKSRAVELATERWILSLDADEALSDGAANEVKSLFHQGHGPDDVDGFIFPRLSFHLGRWIRYGGWYPDRQLRLFERSRASWEISEVHERVKAQKTQVLTHPILHWVFKDLSHQVITNDKYSTLGMVELGNKGKKFSYLMLVFKPISKFLETYIFKRGFLDGTPGFIISIGAAYSIFLKFAKLYEAQRINGKKK